MSENLRVNIWRDKFKSDRLRVNPGGGGGGGALGYFSAGYVPPGTPNWHPVLKKISPIIGTPF